MDIICIPSTCGCQKRMSIPIDVILKRTIIIQDKLNKYLVPVDVGKRCNFPGNGVTDHCEPPHRGWELSLVICKKKNF